VENIDGPEMISERADDSNLCLRCGLCCNGGLHERVMVRPEDAPSVAALGLTLVRNPKGNLGFAQPCPLYRDDRCTVYAQRPPPCRSFRCALLQQYDAAQISFADAAVIIDRAKDLLAGDCPQELRQRVAEWHEQRADSPPASAEAALRAAAFDVLLTKHFRGESEIMTSHPIYEKRKNGV
jgi:Fe-S-cluster containining protein